MRDLKATIPGAPNFTYGEVVRSDAATRLGISNEPTEAQWQAAERFARNILQPVRNRFGRLRITSWFRSPMLCMAIGSSSSSNHTQGDTADIEPMAPGVTLLDVLEFIHDELPFRELIAEYFPDGWVHVCSRPGLNESVLKLKDPDHHYARVTIDQVHDLYGG